VKIWNFRFTLVPVRGKVEISILEKGMKSWNFRFSLRRFEEKVEITIFKDRMKSWNFRFSLRRFEEKVEITIFKGGKSWNFRILNLLNKTLKFSIYILFLFYKLCHNKNCLEEIGLYTQNAGHAHRQSVDYWDQCTIDKNAK
jgi:hypothetical protein